MGKRQLRERRGSRRWLVLPLVALVMLWLPTGASGAALDTLWKAPEDLASGSGAGRFNNPWGIAADPAAPGLIYVADLTNRRIDVVSAWGTFVRAWGWNVAPDGAPGDTAVDALEVCTTSCQAGTSGNGAGQFREPFGMAVDEVGAVYVHDRVGYRVQKFSSDGEFLLMFGAEVNKTKVVEREEQEANAEPITVTEQEENLCTQADLLEGEECGSGVPDVGAGELSNDAIGTYLTYNRVSDSIFFGDTDRIQEFGTDGTFEAEISLPVSEDNPSNRDTGALAADPLSGDLYLAFAQFALQKTPDVIRLSRTTGGVLGSLEVAAPRAIAADVNGTVYVAWEPTADPGINPPEVVAFDSDGVPLDGMRALDHFAIGGSGVSIHGLATNICPGSEAPGNLLGTYFNSGAASSVAAFGSGPIGCEEPPKPAPPLIVAQYATAVGTDTAVLKAQINPVFWPDTTYYLQYGTAPCSGGGCQAKPVPPGLVLTSKSIRAPIITDAIALTDLLPATTYHYRFVSESSGSEGEEVIGAGGAPGSPGLEGTFRTFPLPLPLKSDCANQVFRSGQSSRLPDCRAYEMVSPLDKNNGDILVTTTPSSGDFPAGHNQSAITGERITYSSATAFGATPGAPYSSQYLGERHPLGSDDEGWASESISPPRTQLLPGLRVGPIDTEYKAFSTDLCTAWLRTTFDPPLGQGGVAGYPNLYRRDNCGNGGYVGVTPVEPQLPPVPDTPYLYLSGLKFQGASDDGSVAFYIAPDDFAGTGASANPDMKPQLYEYRNGQLRFACTLPSGSASKQGCYLGTLGVDHRRSNLRNAVAADGSRFYWTQSSGVEGLGELFLGMRGAPSIRMTNSPTRFWGAARDGSRAIYQAGDTIVSFDAEKAIAEEPGETTVIAGGSRGVLGMSEDASHVYFASSEAIADAGQNSEGDSPAAGQPNLYLWVEGEGKSFLGTLSGLDTEGRLSAVNVNPVFRTSRVSPDGNHVAFTSGASLTGYDNTDAVSGKPDIEVFLYDATGEELRCISCNPSGARPLGGAFSVSGSFPAILIAAKLTPWESPFYASRALSSNGERLFFESYEALVPRDTNGAQDVYQWQKAAGEAECVARGAQIYVDDAGGCLSLISAGTSSRDSSFVDADPSGEDVFFTTASSLIAADYGLVDIYDARIGGGFPEKVKQPECEGDACQPSPSPPAVVTPASVIANGPGNVKKAPRCGKGKRLVRKNGKQRCAKKKQRKQKKQKKQKRTRANHGRAGR